MIEQRVSKSGGASDSNAVDQYLIEAVQSNILTHRPNQGALVAAGPSGLYILKAHAGFECICRFFAGGVSLTGLQHVRAED